MNPRTAYFVRRELAAGFEPQWIAEQRDIPLRLVEDVANGGTGEPSPEEPGYRDSLQYTATRLVRSGFDWKVVYANFCDAIDADTLETCARRVDIRLRKLRKQGRL